MSAAEADEQLNDLNQLYWQIRIANRDDTDAVTECVRLAYDHYVERMGKPPGPMTENYEQVIRRNEVHVAESKTPSIEGILGVMVLIADAERCLLDNVAVVPSAQGLGLGRALISLAERRAIELGYKHIQLYTHRCMVENLALYPRLGYRETKRVVEKGYSRVYFEKSLNEEDFFYREGQNSI